MAEVSIIGSGNVGANTAFFIAEQGITDVALYDLRDGLATGKALDMMEAAPIRGYRTRLAGIDAIEGIAGSRVVVLAAGRGRTPGMKREDLFQANAELVSGLARRVAELAPRAHVIVATEPVDLNTRLFVASSGLPRTQVVGLGGFLDSTRLRYLVARELRVSPDNVSALVIGRHGDEMIAPPRYCTVSGVPLPQLLPPARVAALVEEVRRAGDLIVDMAQRASAYYAPSAAVAEVVDAVHMDLRRTLSLSVVLAGEYGLHDVALSLPVVVGREGVLQVRAPILLPEELEQLTRSAADLDVLYRRSLS
jgi:malate dehydrogenase